MAFQLRNTIFTGTNFPLIALHVFVCDSENYKDKSFRNYFCGKSHSGVYLFYNIFGVDFAIMSGWCVGTLTSYSRQRSSSSGWPSLLHSPFTLYISPCNAVRYEGLKPVSSGEEEIFDEPDMREREQQTIRRQYKK